MNVKIIHIGKIRFPDKAYAVTCTFESGKLLKRHLMEENLQQRTILIE